MPLFSSHPPLAYIHLFAISLPKPKPITSPTPFLFRKRIRVCKALLDTLREVTRRNATELFLPAPLTGLAPAKPEQTSCRWSAHGPLAYIYESQESSLALINTRFQ